MPAPNFQSVLSSLKKNKHQTEIIKATEATEATEGTKATEATEATKVTETKMKVEIQTDKHEEQSRNICDDTKPTQLYVNNMPGIITSEELLELFSYFGELIGSHLLKDQGGEQVTASGFVRFKNYKDAKVAIAAVNNFELGGQKIQVRFANSQNKTAIHKGGQVNEKKESTIRRKRKRYTILPKPNIGSRAGSYPRRGRFDIHGDARSGARSSARSAPRSSPRSALRPASRPASWEPTTNRNKSPNWSRQDNYRSADWQKRGPPGTKSSWNEFNQGVRSKYNDRQRQDQWSQTRYDHRRW